MSSFFDGSDIQVRPDIRAAFDREWDRLARPGAGWDGSQRVALARRAREARSGTETTPDLPDAAAQAATLLGANPAEARRDWVAEVAGAIGPERYVELVGVVARTAAVDAFHHAIGAELPDHPDPIDGEPHGAIDPMAAAGPAWVPMVGGASIVFALSLVPDAAAAQEDLHGPLYLTYELMADDQFVRGLTRAQMELVAARTSAVNECFY